MDSNTILMNADGTFPVSHDGNIIIYGSGRHQMHHVMHKSMGGSMNTKLMHNLSLFDTKVKRTIGGNIEQKPNFQRKPIKFII